MTAPNIILLIFDDMTFEQLQRMPQLMRLGLTGVNFINAVATTALCQPGRMTLLTGQYSHNHGLVDNTLAGYPIDHTTMLAARLQTVGYQTHHVGKYLNSWNIANPIPAGWNGWHHTNPMQYYGYSINDNGVTTAPPDYITDTMNSRALAVIGSATQPFFMQVAYKPPHHDIPTTDFLNATPAPSYAGVTPISRVAPRILNFNAPMGTPPSYMAHAAMDSGKISEVDAFWRGQTEMLYSADRSVQAIVAALTAASMIGNTVIIATSDHGYMHGEGRDPASKIAPYWSDVHIPLIISGPSSLVAQSKSCNQLVSQLDVASTIYALSGAISTRTLDGISLSPLLANPTGAALRNNLMLEFLGNSGSGTSGGTGWGVTVPTCCSILSPSYLYTLYATGEEELYDRLTDPYQLTNVSGNNSFAGVKSDLVSRMTALRACSGSSCLM